MKYTSFKPKYFETVQQMALLLFPNQTEKEAMDYVKEVNRSAKEEIFIAIEDAMVAGFVNVSLRFEYVEGAQSSPVGYIEAIYVKPDFRHRGIARTLYAIAEAWAKDRECTQMGSDTWDWNQAAINFHQKLGFLEEDTLVHFIKDIEI